MASSPTARLLHQVGCDFDQLATDLPGDAAFISGLAAAAVARVAAPPRTTRWPAGWVAMAVVLASLSLVGSAAAVVGVWRASVRGTGASASVPTLPTPSPLPTTSVSGSPGHTTAATASPAATAATSEAVTETSSPPQHAARAAQVAATTKSANEGSAGAAELFSSANAARRRGDPHASELYAELQRQYPRSAEAAVSHVVVARILLGDSPAEALRHFDAYLLLEPGGGLAQEALRGKAVALGRLGRSAEERPVWRDLLRRFPRSVYADAARERLGETE